MGMFLIRMLVAGLIVASVVELAPRLPRAGALVLTLPVTSIIAFVFTWHTHREISTIAALSRETLVLVPLGLLFFVPLALADRWNLSFWTAFVSGVGLAGAVIGAWFRFGPALG